MKTTVLFGCAALALASGAAELPPLFGDGVHDDTAACGRIFPNFTPNVRPKGK